MEIVWHHTEQPSPQQIAWRVTMDTGNQSLCIPDPGRPLTGGNGGFGIAGEAADRFAVMVGWQYPDTTESNWAEIGRYDPAAGTWRFPEEYVPDDEREGVLDFLERVVLPGAVAREDQRRIQGEAVIDIRHPLTAAVRLHLAELLRELDLQDIIARANAVVPEEAIAADDYTGCYPVLMPLNQVEAVLDEGHTLTSRRTMLGLCFDGVTKFTDHGKERARRIIHLATRPSNGGSWMPDANYVDAASGSHALALGKVLDHVTLNTPAFSPQHCALVHNRQRLAVT